MPPECQSRERKLQRHTNTLQMFSVINEIKDDSQSSMTSVVSASVGTAAGVYLLVALTGYLTFGDNVVGNIVSQCKSKAKMSIDRH